jgi:hypothetical protein
MAGITFRPGHPGEVWVGSCTGPSAVRMAARATGRCATACPRSATAGIQR